ncbi:MAG: polymer-forming cytoskeletal protein [Alphaproteobacteria bacterium]|nr:polymer-forming cytoskeletal protein [Alphaproteobacteria bacterium]
MIWKGRKSIPTPGPMPEVASAPARPAEPPRTTLSIIGPNLTVSGSLRSESDIVVHGRVAEGIACRVATVGETGLVGGEIVARNVRLMGRCDGQVRAQTAVIGPAAKLGGDLTCGGDAEVMGEVRGNVTGQTITVRPSAAIHGAVRGQVVHVQGTVQGNIEALDVTIAATAVIVGNITHNTIAIERGATHKGLRPWRARARV